MVTDGLTLDVTVVIVHFPERGGMLYGDSTSKGAEYYVASNTGYGTDDSSCYGYLHSLC